MEEPREQLRKQMLATATPSLHGDSVYHASQEQREPGEAPTLWGEHNARDNDTVQGCKTLWLLVSNPVTAPTLTSQRLCPCN